VEFVLAGTISVHQYIWRSMLLEGKVTLFWETLRSHVLICWVIYRTGIWSQSLLLTFYWLIPRLRLHYIIVGEWYWSLTVDSHRAFDNIYCVRRKVRSADKQVDHCYQLYQAYLIHITCISCQKLYHSIIWLFVNCIVYNWQHKVYFWKSVVLYLQLFQILPA